MGAGGLERAIRNGAPLADVVVRLRSGIDYTEATRRLNALADDFDLHPGEWYGDPALRIGTATKEALGRLFGWRLVRVPLEQYDESSGVWSTHADVFRWEEVSEPTTFPSDVADLIEAIWLTQPGADDRGQWWD